MGNSTSHPHGPHGPHPHGPGGPGHNNSSLPPSTHSPARRPSPQTRPNPASATSPSSAIPASVSPTRPYKTKKRSIELPDLQSMSITPQRNPSSTLPPSAPIPIPNAAGRPPRDPPPRLVSDADLTAGPSSLVVAPPPPPLVPVNPPNGAQTAVPPPAAARIPSNASFSSKRIKDGPKKRKTYKQHIVRSYLPSGVPTAHDGIVNVAAPTTQEDDRVVVLVNWRSGGKKVLVTGTYEATPWENKTELEYESVSKTFKTLLHVRPGAYHLKFIVDDVWKCSDDLPTATDGAGHLVNYIDVRRRGEEIKEWGTDWWGVGTEEEEEHEQGAWTTVIPPYLNRTAEQEELDQAARKGQRIHGPRIVPFALPRPPVLPRHLDKVILNQRVSSTRSGTTRERGRSGSNASLNNGRAVWPQPSPLSGMGGQVPPGLAPGVGPTGSIDLDGERRSRRRRAATAAAENTSPIEDDNSVLPMPSHSVVNHLATSAIKNGVLAVGTTTRYKAKYISTICYRPTKPHGSSEDYIGEEEGDPMPPPPSSSPAP